MPEITSVEIYWFLESSRGSLIALLTVCLLNQTNEAAQAAVSLDNPACKKKTVWKCLEIG